MKTEQSNTNWNGDIHEINRLATVGNPGAVSGLHRFSAACLDKLDQIKKRVTNQLAAEYGHTVSAKLLKQAVLEADSIASTTMFPGLFLPTLAEEKVQLAYAWSNRQRQIRNRSMAFAE
ncbi:MAG TPA: hypothetical protein PKA41_05950 [Verrucomicrobiota bacterium]|nr:hypothetical protein [Verrucomicrobiota bacterium]